jgi:hypothetical protein
MLTVVVLAVLWLIVVVPMIVRRNDARAGERSVLRFASAMRALGSRGRSDAAGRDGAESIDDDEFATASRAVASATADRDAAGVVHRRPVPVAKESLMYPPDRSEMSEARRQMMARRRRSLTALGAGSFFFLLIAMLTGATLVWVVEVFFLVGLAGYLGFLRAQARRDRERRQTRLERARGRADAVGYDATAFDDEMDDERIDNRPVRMAENVVRIDEDDVDLDHLDTVDLTGLYSEVEFDDVPIRRAG